MNKLLAEYSGSKAVNYENRRSKTARWKNEILAMESLLSSIKASVVLDCPFGTGRWLPQYEAINAKVIGVDLSKSMLQEAANKGDAIKNNNSSYQFLEGNIFEIDKMGFEPLPDLIVCIRFLNWVSYKDAQTILSKIVKMSPENIIIGVSVRASDTNWLTRLKQRAGLIFTNLYKFKSPTEYVHDERQLELTIEKLGWNITEKKHVFSNSSRDNFFYLLSMKSAA